MKRIKTINVSVKNMSEEDETKVLYAAELVLAFFKSDTFRINFFMTDMLKLRGESKKSISKRLVRDDLFTLFMTGKEEWNGIDDYEIDLNIVKYRKRFSNVIGYMIPMKPEIHVNAKFFDRNSVEQVADNLCHEWAHTLGFRHSGKHKRESLPYLINKWFKQWSANNTPMPRSIKQYKTVCERRWYTLWLVKHCYKVVTNE